MSIVKVNNENFQQEVIDSDKKVLIDFFADWCGPCKMLSPIVDKLAQENEDVKIVKINIDEESDLANKYQIMSIPTLVVVDKGEVIRKNVGLCSKQEIEEMLK